MKFKLYWLLHNEVYSLGVLQSEDKLFKCFVMADPPRNKKIPKLTRSLVDGVYPLQIKKADTPLTIKHRQIYGNWFKFHIEIMQVPNFDSIYIHSGIDAAHTDGCLITMYAFDMKKAANQGGLSIISVKDFYSKVYPLLEAGTPCFIEVKALDL